MSHSKFFMMIKPDGVRRGLVGKIISRFEKRGFVLLNMYMIDSNDNLSGNNKLSLLQQHYEEHSSKGFYQGLIEFMNEGSVIPMLWKGNLEVAREMIGSTIPRNALVGTIRGDYASSIPENLIHCSDGPESAAREVSIWFPDY